MIHGQQNKSDRICGEKIGIIVFFPKQLGWGGEFSCGPVAVLNLKYYLYETYD